MFVAAHELRNENQTLGKEENILLQAVDLRFTLNTDKPNQTEVTKIATMYRQKEFSTTGPTILLSPNMTLEKFLNGMSCETRYGRVIQTDTAREAINHVKTFRLQAREAGCQSSEVEKWACEIMKDASMLSVSPADQIRGHEMLQIRADQAELNMRIQNGEVDANGGPLQPPVPGFQAQIDVIVNASRIEYGERLNNYINTMFIPMLKTKVEEGIKIQKLQADVEQLKKERPTPYSKQQSSQDLYCLPVVPKAGKGGKGKGGKGKGGKGAAAAGTGATSTYQGPMPKMCLAWAWGDCPSKNCSLPHRKVSREDFDIMKKSEKLKGRMENLEYHMLPEDE
eukprot:g12805.t1